MSKPAVWDLVIEDMKNRDEKGTEEYGTRLVPFNGRNPLWDAYEEALDMAVYLRQAIYELEASEPPLPGPVAMSRIDAQLEDLAKVLRQIPMNQSHRKVSDLLLKLTH